MGAKERLTEDLSFHATVPICLYCQNKIEHEYLGNPYIQDIMTCKVLGKIPREIDIADIFKCKHFILDKKQYEMYKDLTYGLDVTKINK